MRGSCFVKFFLRENINRQNFPLFSGNSPSSPTCDRPKIGLWAHLYTEMIEQARRFHLAEAVCAAVLVAFATVVLLPRAEVVASLDSVAGYGLDRAKIATCGVHARRALAEQKDVGAAAWQKLGRCLEAYRHARPGILFVHISKSGGTSMCQRARREGCTSYGNNCWMVGLDDGPNWIDPAVVEPSFLLTAIPSQRRARHVATCQQRLAFAVSRGINFVAIENFLSEEMVAAEACMAELVGVIYIRSTLSRLHSHYRNAVKLWPQLGWVRGLTSLVIWPDGKTYGKFTAELLSRSLSNFAGLRRPWATPDLAPSELWWASQGAFLNTSASPAAFDVERLSHELNLISDNYVTRTLAGDEAFHLPFGRINRSHFEVALRTLRNLEWVLPLESPRKEIVLQSGLGWSARSSNEAEAHEEEAAAAAAGAAAEASSGTQALAGSDAEAEPSTEAMRWAMIGAAASQGTHAASPGMQNVFQPGNSANVDRHKDKFAPFSKDDERLLTELNVYDLRLEAEAARLHALDVESLEQLQRHYPQALASPPPNGDACCGSSCIRGERAAQAT